MGSFDCYCAACGARLLGYGVQIGSTSPTALARRRKLVHETCRALSDDGTTGSSASGVDTEESCADGDEEEGSSSDGVEEDEGSDGSWWEEDEDASYDPELVSTESLGWLGDVRCLGYNPNASGTRKCAPLFRTCPLPRRVYPSNAAANFPRQGLHLRSLYGQGRRRSTRNSPHIRTSC